MFLTAKEHHQGIKPKQYSKKKKNKKQISHFCTQLNVMQQGQMVKM
jgi:hypothetical protein